MANKEEGIFVVAEDELGDEVVFCVDEEQLAFDKPEIEFLFDTTLPEGEAGDNKKKEIEEKNKSWLESHDVEKFHEFLDAEMARIKSPLAARSSLSEMERAFAQWNELNRHVSRALRDDYSGKLDVPVIDKKRAVIQNNIDQLQYLLDNVKGIGKGKKRRAEEEQDGIVKEAGTPMYLGIQTNMTLFETAVVRSLINGVVSGGSNIEELYEKFKEKYDISEREELALFQALSDMGYPTFKDRAKIGDKDQDVSDPDSVGEWQKQYYS
jgi:hypothetical protein